MISITTILLDKRPNMKSRINKQVLSPRRKSKKKITRENNKKLGLSARPTLEHDFSKSLGGCEEILSFGCGDIFVVVLHNHTLLRENC
jgi:hypothetical protein